MCNLDTHEFSQYALGSSCCEECVPVNPARNVVMDLDANGRRWEGTLMITHMGMK